MTAAVKTRVGNSNRTLSISNQPESRWVTVSVRDGYNNMPIEVDRAEFLAAAAKELDVVIAVTDKGSLPRITVRGGEAAFDYGQEGHTEPLPEGISPDEMIALGLHLKAHPPVDEAAASRMADALAIADIGMDATERMILARRLLATGRVTAKGV